MECNDMLNAQEELWKLTFCFLKSMTLKCAIELGIPDAIHNHGQAMNLHELHAALSLPINNRPNFRRLLRMLSHLGFLVARHTGEKNEEVYDLTPISRLVINKTNSTSLSSFVLVELDFALVKPSLHLADWLKQDKLENIEMTHGCTIWELTGRRPELNTLVNDGMANDSSFISDFLVREHADVFQGISSLVDVGGGSGSIAIAIAKAFPNIQCTVLDLPQVIGHLPTDHGLVKFVSGDMFSNIPPAEALLLKWVMHDWCDEDCIKLLRRCKEAIAPTDAGGKVIIIDIVVREIDAGHRETQLLFDMLMMTLTKGKERDEEEWWNLFKAAGFNSYKIAATIGVRSIIEVYP